MVSFRVSTASASFCWSSTARVLRSFAFVVELHLKLAEALETLQETKTTLGGDLKAATEKVHQCEEKARRRVRSTGAMEAQPDSCGARGRGPWSGGGAAYREVELGLAWAPESKAAEEVGASAAIGQLSVRVTSRARR